MYTKTPRTLVVAPRRRPPMGDDLDGLAMVAAWFDMASALDAASAPPADQVNQTAGGGTSTSVADFVSVGGVCKPRNFPAMYAVRELQNQLNRVAQVKGFSKTSTDGSVGPKTVALFRQVQAVGAGSVMGDPSSCIGVAADADVLAGQVKAVADTLGAPATVSAGLANASIVPPTIVTKSGKTVVAPDAGLSASLATMPSVMKVALLGLAGGIGYLLFVPPKKRRK